MGLGGAFERKTKLNMCSVPCAPSACSCRLELKMSEQKHALMQFGNNCLCIDVPSASSSRQSEREVFVERIREVYSDLLPSGNYTIFLQRKAEDWGGVFIDYFDDTVPDRSVFKMIAKPVQVLYICIIHGYFDCEMAIVFVFWGG